MIISMVTQNSVLLPGSCYTCIRTCVYIYIYIRKRYMPVLMAKGRGREQCLPHPILGGTLITQPPPRLFACHMTLQCTSSWCLSHMQLIVCVLVNEFSVVIVLPADGWQVLSITTKWIVIIHQCNNKMVSNRNPYNYKSVSRSTAEHILFYPKYVYGLDA